MLLHSSCLWETGLGQQPLLGGPKGSGSLHSMALPGAVWTEGHLSGTGLWARDKGTPTTGWGPDASQDNLFMKRISFCINWAVICWTVASSGPAGFSQVLSKCLSSLTASALAQFLQPLGQHQWPTSLPRWWQVWHYLQERLWGSLSLLGLGPLYWACLRVSVVVTTWENPTETQFWRFTIQFVASQESACERSLHRWREWEMEQPLGKEFGNFFKS